MAGNPDVRIQGFAFDCVTPTIDCVMNGSQSTRLHTARDGFLLAIPVFNEERHVIDVVNRARRYCSDILLIDDGSTDDTPRHMRELPGIRVIRHAENRGYGKSLADAFDFAIRRNYRWLITMDCDNQHEPSAIPRFQAAASQDNADIISGTRYPAGRTVDAAVPADRRDINRRITAILNRRLRLNLTDAFCGFKAYRVSALASLDITVPGYAMPMQFWIQAAATGLRIREIPVRLIYNDPTRHFGGLLDDPDVRYAHYLEVLEAELTRTTRFQKHDWPCAPCR
jgi:glycosyltransferase involved in cell wall biosynthesis